MTLIASLCSSSVAIIVLLVVSIALLKKKEVFSLFCEGAKNGLASVVSILAPTIALMCAISMLRSSGIIDFIARLIHPLTSIIGLSEELLPLALLRPVSGSGSTAIVNDIAARLGPDSPITKTACVMAGATETTFYTLAVYFSSVNIKNIRYSMYAALFADAVSIIASLIVCKLFF